MKEETKLEDTWYYKQHKKNGMLMTLDDIGSVVTLTSAETEELARTGRLKSDDKFKKRKLDI
jgi:hypothetical protein